jgi:hypothetical protein
MAIETTSDSPKTHEQRAAARRCCEPPGPDGSMRFFRMQQLWDLAKGHPVTKIRVADIKGFDEVHWFGGPRNLLPTCRAIAEHARDIFDCDLSHPIILAPDGEVLDGWHRICKAHIQGIAELDSIQLATMPPYRWRVLITGEEIPIADAQ